MHGMSMPIRAGVGSSVPQVVRRGGKAASFSRHNVRGIPLSMKNRPRMRAVRLNSGLT